MEGSIAARTLLEDVDESKSSGVQCRIQNVTDAGNSEEKADEDDKSHNCIEKKAPQHCTWHRPRSIFNLFGQMSSTIGH